MGVALSSHERDETERVLVAGRPNYHRCDNKIKTSKYNLVTFLPKSTREQLRRLANVYFVCIGIIMSIGNYTTYFETAYSPWTIIWPLATVMSISFAVEGYADIKRHQSDRETNNAECIILRRVDDIKHDHAERDTSIIGGNDVVVNMSKSHFRKSSSHTLSTRDSKPTSREPHLVRVAFQKIKRMNIRQGHIVLIRNREAVPADTVILRTSGENGCAYIETSSIDGETNLKLRNSPKIPSLDARSQSGEERVSSSYQSRDDKERMFESLEKATKYITRLSSLGYPDGLSSLDYSGASNGSSRANEKSKLHGGRKDKAGRLSEKVEQIPNEVMQPIATLVSELPNSNINTFSGKLVLPPFEKDGECMEVPIDAENVLLRGAILRNTEWVIGISCFTGNDTKLIRNSFRTPSKFSRIDVLINKCVVLIVTFMLICIGYLSVQAILVTNERFDELWYIGNSYQSTAKWPYLPDQLPPPKWNDKSNSFIQNFLTFVTLLSNFVPLSMYVTLEMVNVFCLWLVHVDCEMYDPKTDTPAIARSTNVTDLGQVQYIFSDKTGTLTQNVMRFKRCSVDGMIFGAPVEKMRPQDIASSGSPIPVFHPTRQLVVGKITYSADNNRVEASSGMTFNAEMFVRVMSFCHTVVVEKDLDNCPNIDESKSVSSSGSSWILPVSIKKKLFANRYGRACSDMSVSSAHALETVSEEPSENAPLDFSEKGTSRSSLASMIHGVDGHNIGPLQKGRDGAPSGFAYQAESPDENALVSEASKTLGFQLVSRNSSGITLRSEHPTILSDEKLVRALRNGTLSSKSLVSSYTTERYEHNTKESEERLKYTKHVRTETWEILAINKFDSERKRMSILLRSPSELGGVTILFCKGADSAMLDSDVCSGSKNLFSGDAVVDAMKSHEFETRVEDNEDSEWDTAQLLGIQSHLGEFASEGLRTLVLGIRFLTDIECAEWLKRYRKAASSLKSRDAMLRDAALEIEKDLHIVGATAVEDKLQANVPETIATLEKAGIKIWVLTGDKKETAIEIGYSTKVLTPNIHLTEIGDQGADFVRAQCAMEFMRLVKAGKLPLYQKVAIDQSNHKWSWNDASFLIRKRWRSFLQFFEFLCLALLIYLRKSLGFSSTSQEKAMKSLKEEHRNERERLKDDVRRRHVRSRAEEIIKKFKSKYPPSLNSQPSSPSSDDLSNDALPKIFNRAKSARSILESRSFEGSLASSTVRNIRISQLTAQEVAEHCNNEEQDTKEIDEDLLSLKSINLATAVSKSNFDQKKRTVFERLFAVDRDVRKGRLLKHVKKDRVANHSSISPSGDGPRALIIEGNALRHLLGDDELEELVFNIASQCNAVIACRVSPQQKALLVKLVRYHVVPEPVTLAIGDGANDVGMIQEAHVGIGISGKEGKQAVNASDFAISQFRFLGSLLLVHGRWDFMRQATVVLFSFYKNAVLAGCLIVFSGSTLFSGQTLFDQWAVSSFNFLVFLPIFFLGIFDRCLEKDYIKKNPDVYQPTRQNEVLTVRVLFRWIFMTISHTMILYFGSFYYLSGGSGSTSAFSGLMRFHKRVGDGEGSDLNSVGLVIFSSTIIMMAYKVLYESRSIINGKWPPWWKSRRDDFFSRLPYSWYGVTIGSIYFHFFFFLPIYNKISKTTEKKTSSGFFDFVGVMPHVLGTSSVNYISLTFIPIAGMAFDVCLKVFSNMFYPTQTQIHAELETKQLTEDRSSQPGSKSRKKGNGTWRA